MISAGEDPKFIARRLVISASEDIGLANPNALLLANAAFDAVQKIGWPEGRIPLAEATIYLATSPKSNSAYLAINKALEIVNETGNQPVPLHLRNAPTTLMKEMGYVTVTSIVTTIRITLLSNNTCPMPFLACVYGRHNILLMKKSYINKWLNAGEIGLNRQSTALKRTFN